MHKYIPRLHIIQAVNSNNNETKLSMAPFDNVNIFVFPEAQFIAVTAYQNEQVRISFSRIHYSCVYKEIFLFDILGHSFKNR